MKTLFILMILTTIGLAAEPIVTAQLVRSDFVPHLESSKIPAGHPRLYLRIEVLNKDNYPYDGELRFTLPGRNKVLKVPLFTWPNSKVAQVSYIDLGSVYISDEKMGELIYKALWEKK